MSTIENFPELKDLYRTAITQLVNIAHKNSREKGFWDNPAEEGTLVALMHSELSEALEAIRNPKHRDSHLPHLDPVGVEFADVIIRIFDYCGGLEIDLATCLTEKMQFNAGRERMHGKKF